MLLASKRIRIHIFWFFVQLVFGSHITSTAAMPGANLWTGSVFAWMQFWNVSLSQILCLTLWEPVYDILYSYFDFSLKNSSFRLPYQCPSSSADCARELFKGSNGSVSLVDCTQKIFLVGRADVLWLTS